MLTGKTLLAAFGNNHIKLALAGRNRKRTVISCCEKIEAPVASGEITDITLMKAIFLDYIGKNKIKGCRLKIVLQHPNSLIRILRIPNIKAGGQLLDKEIKSRLEELFPASNTQYIVDYRAEKTEEFDFRVVAIRIPEAAALCYVDFFGDIGIKPIMLDTCANAVSVYLERCVGGNYLAVFENPLSINILGFTKGKLTSSRDIRYENRDYAISELRKYLLLQCDARKAFLFTDMGIAREALSCLDIKIHETSGMFMEFYGLFKDYRE